MTADKWGPGLLMSALKTSSKRSFLIWVKSGEKARLVGKNTSGHQYVVLGRGWGMYSMLHERSRPF